MGLRAALNAGTVKHLPLEEQVRVCSWAGFSSFGLWAKHIDDFRKSGGTLQQAFEFFRNAEVSVIEVDFLRDWAFATKAELDQVLVKSADIFAIARYMNCNLICAASLSDRYGSLRHIAPNFRELCNLAREYDVTLGFEFLPWTPVPNILKAWDIVDRAGCENSGLIIDTFHFFFGNSQLAHIRQVPVEKLLHVHISDMRHPKGHTVDLMELTRRHRVYPGEGWFPLEKFVEELRNVGYHGALCLEVLSDENSKMSGLEIADRAQRSLRPFVA